MEIVGWLLMAAGTYWVTDALVNKQDEPILKALIAVASLGCWPALALFDIILVWATRKNT